MSTRTLSILSTCVFAAVLCATGAAAAPPEGEGWVSLFNGKDLTGWNMRIKPEDVVIWKVVDGVIDCSPRLDVPGDKNLWSDKSYKDFELVIDWRLKETRGEYNMLTILPDGTYKTDAEGKVIVTPTPNADSGIYLRGSSKAQLNIWCWPIGSGEIWGYRTDEKMPPEVRAGGVPKVRADKPVGEWNTFHIALKGDVVTVKLNGKTVIDKAKLPDIPEEGPLALQHHGGYHPGEDIWNSASSLVQFRNIYIRELK